LSFGYAIQRHAADVAEALAKMMEGKMKSILLASVLVLGLAGAVRPVVAADVRLFIRHDVADYATWRKGYDAFEVDRKSLGVTGDAVYQSVDNPNDVTVWHDFKNAEAAKAFGLSPNLKAAMDKNGVRGTPQVWLTNPAGK
jgi:hypothetical protein